MNNKLKEKITEILEECVDTDWGWYGEDEIPETAVNEELLTKRIMSLLKTQKKEIREKIERMKLMDMGATHSRITGSIAYQVPFTEKTKGYNQALDDILKEI